MKKRLRGFPPPPAAAPTYPSFRDNQLKKQCPEFSRNVFLGGPPRLGELNSLGHPDRLTSYFACSALLQPNYLQSASYDRIRLRQPQSRGDGKVGQTVRHLHQRRRDDRMALPNYQLDRPADTSAARGRNPKPRHISQRQSGATNA